MLDYCAGGELFFHLSRFKKFPENMARFYAAEISLALDALHAIVSAIRNHENLDFALILTSWIIRCRTSSTEI